MSTSLNVHRANVTKNLMRLQPARFPFLCKEAYPRIRGVTLQHVVRKTKWDIKQSLFNQRAAYEEGRSHLNEGRSKGSRNLFHSAVMADVEESKANLLLARLCKNNEEMMLASLSVLVEHYPLIFSVFKAYAAHTDFSFAMNLTSFTEFVTDCELVDNDHCFLAHFDNIFVAVNAVSNNTINSEFSHIAIRNNKHTMSRSEFLASIVRIADLRYGAEAPVPLPLNEALCCLISKNIEPKAQRLPGDTFRRHVLYTEEVDRVLREHRDRLCKCYEEVTKKENGFVRVPKRLKERKLSLNEYTKFLTETNLLPEVIHERSATECFTGALLLVEREYLEPHRMGTMYDFFEMIVRLAMVLHDSMDENLLDMEERTYQISDRVEDLDDFASLLDAFVLEVLDGRSNALETMLGETAVIDPGSDTGAIGRSRGMYSKASAMAGSRENAISRTTSLNGRFASSSARSRSRRMSIAPQMSFR